MGEDLRVNFPEIAGMFDPVAYKPPADADQNNLSTIIALSDPKEALKRIQSENILKGMAGLKLDGIDIKHEKMALDEIQNYIQGAKDMYSQRKGFQRLSLSPEQQLESDQKYRSMLTRVNWLKEAKDDYAKTMERARGDFAKGIMTAEEFKAFSEDIDKRYNGATSIKDVPLTSAVYDNYLANKPYDWNSMSKDMDAAMKGAKTQKTVIKEGAERYNAEILEPVPIVESLFYYNPKFQKFWLDQTGGDVTKAMDMAKAYGEKFRVDNRTWGGNIRQDKDTFEEWKRKYDYSHSEETKNTGIIPRDSDSDGYVWNFQALPVKPKWSGDATSTTGQRINLSNAEILSVHSDPGKKAWMTVQGQIKGDPSKQTYIAEVPFSRSLLADIKKQNPGIKELDGWDAPLSGKYGETVKMGEKTTQYKSKNPNYKGYDTGQVKDKSGKVRKIVWDDSIGNYVYAD